jgi:nucleoside-diphosphate-sugar epimerase
MEFYMAELSSSFVSNDANDAQTCATIDGPNSTDQKLRHVIITGSNGYIGARLISRLVKEGVFVTSLSRASKTPSQLQRHFIWQLGDPIPDDALDPKEGLPLPDAVIHLAHDWKTADSTESNINVVGTIKLLKQVRKTNIPRFVFSSSVSARPDALNRYGKIKAAIENQLMAPNEISARIGLIYGGALLSQWGNLYRLTRLPVLPMLDPWKLVQPISLDEVCDALMRLAALPEPALPIYGLAAPDPVPFAQFLKLVSQHKHGGKLWLLPVPSQIVLWLLSLLKLIPFIKKIDQERVLGLAGLRIIDCGPSLSELGMALSPLNTGLDTNQHENRRHLIEEGRVLLGYFLHQRPPSTFVRSYVRCVEKTCINGQPEPLFLALPYRIWPRLIRAREPIGGRSLLNNRLDIALRIIEFSRFSIRLLFDYKGTNLVWVTATFIYVGMVELVLMPFRIFFTIIERR